MRPIKTYLPELIRRQINHQALIAARNERQKKLAEKLGRRSKDHFEEGDKVVLQDMASKRWTVKGVIKEGRISEDGSVRSFIIVKENGRETIRNARHIKFEARKEKNRVRFAENLTEEIKTDDEAADSEYEASTDLADSDDLVTNSQNEVNDEPELVTESSPVRASARLAERKPLAQRAC